MTTKKYISQADIFITCSEIAKMIPKGKCFYGVPRGGIGPAMTIAGMTRGVVVSDPALADYIVDDLVDSGATRKRYIQKYPGATFLALFLKGGVNDSGDWLVFPWEVEESGDDKSATDVFTRLLQYVGEDPDREGLRETPARMAKMYTEITRGYNEDPALYFKTFSENADTYDELVMVSPIPFYSICEHHMLPFFGEVYIGYIPDKKFAGLSKFARAVNTFARRLQIQERFTEQIAATINQFVEPLGVGVIVKARHLCMEMRGVEKPGAMTTTSSMKGVFLKDHKARNEFLHLMRP